MEESVQEYSIFFNLIEFIESVHYSFIQLVKLETSWMQSSVKKCIHPPRPNRPLMKAHLIFIDLDFYLDLHQIANTPKYQSTKHIGFVSSRSRIIPW